MQTPARTRKIAGAIFLIAACGILITFHLIRAHATYTVTQVLDVDLLRLDDGREITLVGLDDPENYPGDRDAGLASMRALLSGKAVRVVIADPGGKDVATPPRAYVYLGEVLVNGRVIQDGFAHADISTYYPERELFQVYEQRAKVQGKGLWRR